MRASKDQARHPAGKRHSAEISRTSDTGSAEPYRTAHFTAIPSEAIGAQNEPWLFDSTPFFNTDSVVAPGAGASRYEEGDPPPNPAWCRAQPAQPRWQFQAGAERERDFCAERPSSRSSGEACAIEGVVDPASLILPAASTTSGTEDQTARENVRKNRLAICAGAEPMRRRGWELYLEWADLRGISELALRSLGQSIELRGISPDKLIDRYVNADNRFQNVVAVHTTDPDIDVEVARAFARDRARKRVERAIGDLSQLGACTVGADEGERQRDDKLELPDIGELSCPIR